MNIGHVCEVFSELIFVSANIVEPMQRDARVVSEASFRIPIGVNPPQSCMSYEIRNPQIEAMMREVAKTISAQLPEGWGFSLFLFKFFAEDSFYISSGDREGVVHSIRQWLERMEGKREYGKFYEAVGRITSFAEAQLGATEDTKLIREYLLPKPSHDDPRQS